MLHLFPRGTSIDFLGKRHVFFLISLALVVLGCVRWGMLGQEKYGTDFRGGSEFVVELKGDKDAEALRAALQTAKVDSATVQAFELASRQFSIRVPGVDEAGTKDQVEAALKSGLGEEFVIVRTDFVGPTIGSELRTKAAIAVALGLLAMLAYVTVRFELAFAVGAVVAVLHDVVVSLGLYLWAGFPLTMASIAGALTIVGYSINDTIVVFDRMREDILKGEEPSLTKIMNNGINATLSRTILTSLLTFFSCLALYLFGGGAISDLSFYLCVGVVVGSYSTIYIASPVVLAWHKFRGGSEMLS